jgi:hypothetical protein
VVCARVTSWVWRNSVGPGSTLHLALHALKASLSMLDILHWVDTADPVAWARHLLLTCAASPVGLKDQYNACDLCVGCCCNHEAR